MFRLTTEPLIFVYFAVYFINSMTLPQLVLEKVCLQQYNNITICDHLSTNILEQAQVQKTTSWWMMVLFICTYVPSFFTIIILGPLSDIIGRKKLLIFVTTLFFLQSIVYILNSHYMNAIPAYLIIGAVLSSLYGDVAGVNMLSFSYIADVTTSVVSDRTIRMSLVEFAVWFSVVPAGIGSGFLLKCIGFEAVFIFAAACTFILSLYVNLLLPTVLPKSDDKTTAVDKEFQDKPILDDERIPLISGRSKTWKNVLNPFTHLKEFAEVLFHQKYSVTLLSLVLIFFLSVCGIWTEIFVLPLYLKNAPFNFSPELIGYYYFTQGIIRGCGLLLIPRLSQYMKWSDNVSVIIGLISQAATYISIGASRSVLMVFIANLCGLGMTLPMTTLRSMASKQTAAKHYGAAIGALEVVNILSAIIINFVSLGIYSTTLTIHSGIVFFTVGATSVLALILFIFITCKNGNAEGLKSEE